MTKTNRSYADVRQDYFQQVKTHLSHGDEDSCTISFVGGSTVVVTKNSKNNLDQIYYEVSVKRDDQVITLSDLRGEIPRSLVGTRFFSEKFYTEDSPASFGTYSLEDFGDFWDFYFEIEHFNQAGERSPERLSEDFGVLLNGKSPKVGALSRMMLKKANEPVSTLEEISFSTIPAENWEAIQRNIAETDFCEMRIAVKDQLEIGILLNKESDEYFASLFSLNDNIGFAYDMGWIDGIVSCRYFEVALGCYGPE